MRGGLGNQLFCYAAARRLALANDAELVIDNVTGFRQDHLFHRRYMLDPFHIQARKATAAERLEPFTLYRRGVMRWRSRRRPFAERRYLDQEGFDFDQRLLNLRINGVLYLDGHWQSDEYFRDVESTIREDLRINPPTDALNQRIAGEIRSSVAVAMHVRWFDPPDSASVYNVSADYYHRAIGLMESRVNFPRYFVFSDNPEAVRARIVLPRERVTFVSHNRGDENGWADLWLMSLCRHFIIANSTFSWWGAWLGTDREKIVVAPDLKIDGKTAWGFKGLIPNSWVQLRSEYQEGIVRGRWRRMFTCG